MTQLKSADLDWQNPDDLGFKASDEVLRYVPRIMKGIWSWKITSVGNRPKDHVSRDLLFAPQQRDHRCWCFRQLSKTCPPWMFWDLPFVDRSIKPHVAKFRALQFVHLLHLARLQQNADAHSSRVIARLWGCWPYTVKVAWSRSHSKSKRDVCELAHQCPSCFARSVCELYQRLQQFCRVDRDSLLVLMRIVISDQQLSFDSGLDSAEARRDFARQNIGKRLKTLAQNIGVKGGIISFQMGPQQWERVDWKDDETTRETQYGFQYTISVLGEVRASNNANLLVEAQDENSVETKLAVGDAMIPVSITVRSLDEQQSLRILLVGTSPNYLENSEFAPAGHEGVFALQPWMLSNFHQWKLHMQLTKGMRLFSPWGTWIQEIPKLARPGRLVNASVRRPQYRRKEALRRSNQKCSDEADQATASLLPALRKLVAQEPRFRDHPPGRQKIRELLVGKGIEVSDRQARRLAEEVCSLSSPPVIRVQQDQPEDLQ